jgi:acylphosphatase
MKKSIRLYLTGTVQSLFFRLFVKENADKLGVKGFFRRLEDGRVEIFLEGDSVAVDQMVETCKSGPKHAIIRGFEQKEERLQDFKDFRFINF